MSSVMLLPVPVTTLKSSSPPVKSITLVSASRLALTPLTRLMSTAKSRAASVTPSRRCIAASGGVVVWNAPVFSRL
jgi:hypothetical protein